MKDKRLELRVTQDLLDAIDAARGDVSRTRWVERALEKALQGAPLGPQVRERGSTPRESEDGPAHPSRAAAAPSRTSRPRVVDPAALARQAKLNAPRDKK